VTKNDHAYAVAYSDFPKGRITSEKIDVVLDAVQDAEVKSLNGKILSQVSDTINGFPARRYACSSSVKGEKAICHVALCIVGDRLYEASAIVANTATVTAKDREKFFSSFAVWQARETPRRQVEPK
jgi:hypothetical protein